MAYCTAADVKAYLGVTGTGDDTLLSTLVASAQAAIDAYCNRRFEASDDETRTFSVWDDAEGRRLFLDGDLCAITSVVTNADADTPTTIPATDYVTEPRHKTPYYAIVIKPSSDYEWDYTDDPTDGIAVTGKWAWSTTAPANIKQACIRWAAYMYRQKDAGVFDVTAIPEAGVIQVPQGIPADVVRYLKPFVRL